MPLISVIIPVFNGEKTIRETVASVLCQTLSTLELIVINDGSQDSTLEIISSIQDSRLRVFSYANTGLAASRNRGVFHSTSEYISFIDADDLWTPDKLETQFRALQENPHAAVAYSWTDCIDESSQFLRRGSYMTVSGDVLANLLLVNFLENGSNPLIRRQALSTVNGFDESLPAAQDWDLYLRLAASYHFVAVPCPQILYRVSANSMSTNVRRLESSSLQVIERAFAQAPESLQPLKKYSLANLYKYLTFKVLEMPPAPSRGLSASKFLWYAIDNDPSLLKARVIWKVFLKVVIVALLPPQHSLALLAKFKSLPQIHTILLMQMQTNLF